MSFQDEPEGPTLDAPLLPVFNDWTEGFQIRVSPGHVQPRPDRPKTMEEPIHSFDGRILAIACFDRGAAVVLGSAVMVAEGVALAAMHVLAEYAASAAQGWEDRLFLSGFRPGEHQLWKVQQIFDRSPTDVAILAVGLTGSPLSPIDVSVCEIALRFPRPGETLMAIGFSAEGPGAFEIDDRNIVNIRGGMRSCVGPVTAVYPHGRDRVNLPQPCFEFAADVRGGMSGRPVFNATGQLVAINSTSMLDPEGDDHRSWASAIAPVLADEFQPLWPSFRYPHPIRLLDEAMVADRERMTIDPTGRWHLQG